MDVPSAAGDGASNANGAANVKGIHHPFTKAERMQQLSEIDQDISSLLEITNHALKALVQPPPSDPSDPTSTTQQNPSAPESAAAGDSDNPAIDQQRRAFEAAGDSFFNTLVSVHVRLKRQIWGLEEAGIITLKDGKPGSGGPSLEPNGVGSIGGLDVGWLNSRSNKVERDMEAELWARARAHLETLHGKHERIAGSENL